MAAEEAARNTHRPRQERSGAVQHPTWQDRLPHYCMSFFEQVLFSSQFILSPTLAPGAVTLWRQKGPNEGRHVPPRVRSSIATAPYGKSATAREHPEKNTLPKRPSCGKDEHALCKQGREGLR
jgi:hypothetical protein